MSEVRNPTVTPARVWTIALALALTGAANLADAAIARVAVTGFSFVATPDPIAPYFLFFPDDPGARPQVGKVEAHTNSNAINAGPNILVPSDWSAPGGANATTPQANASIQTTLDTQSNPGYEVPLFSLGASATPLSNGLTQAASGDVQQTGFFCFGDGSNGFPGSGGCNGSGSVTFTLFYDLLASAVPGGLGSLAFASFSVFDIANTLLFNDIASSIGNNLVTPCADPNAPPGYAGGCFSWTVPLALGEFGGFTTAGEVRVVAIPEPSALALAALGIVALVTVRRSRRAVPHAA